MKNKTKNWSLSNICLLLCVFLSGCMISKDITYSTPERNQKAAVSKLINIISNQVTNYENKRRFETADELDVKNRQETGYSIEMKSDDKGFQIWATPKEYPKTGNFSYYADSDDGNIYGADHQGGKATANDPMVEKVSDELKAVLKKSNMVRQ